MIVLRLPALTSPWICAVLTPCLLRYVQIVSILERNIAKMMTLRSVSSKISMSTLSRGDASNSTTSRSSVYAAPEDTCKSLLTMTPALTALMVSPAAMTSICSLSSL